MDFCMDHYWLVCLESSRSFLWVKQELKLIGNAVSQLGQYTKRRMVLLAGGSWYTATRLLWESPSLGLDDTKESVYCLAVDQTVEFVPLLGTERTSAWPPHFTKFAEKSNIWRLLFQIKSELNAFKRYFRKRTHSKKIKLKNCAAGPAVYRLRGREQNNWEIQPMTVLAYRVKWRKSRYKYCTLISALS